MYDRYTWLWAGIFTGIVGMILLLIISENGHSVVELIEKYQTLIAGFIALFGALLTYAAVQKQIATAEAASRETQERRHSAMRAALPLQASKLDDYLVNCLKFYDSLLERIKNDVISIPDQSIKPIELTVPDDVIKFLIDFIEISNPSMQIKIENILLKFQIQNSRLSNLFNRSLSEVIVKTNIFTEIINTAELLKLSEILFTHARGQDFNYRYISSSYEEINSIIFIYVPRSEQFREDFNDLINSRLIETAIK